MNSRSCRTRRSFACVSSGTVPISSKKIVPAVGRLEEALLVGDGAGERAAHVAEEVRLEEVGRERAGVDRHERPGGARREPVERLRDELLAGAALADDEDRRARGRRLPDRLEDPLHRRRAADELAEVAAARRAGP